MKKFNKKILITAVMFLFLLSNYCHDINAKQLTEHNIATNSIINTGQVKPKNQVISNKLFAKKSKQKKSYTVMVYMCGSDLESKYSEGTETLKALCNIGSSQDVNFVVETGGAKTWNDPSISSNTNQRWYINKNSKRRILDVGMKNMGDPSTLSDFITWSKKNYPAEKYMLILMDHGSGPLYGCEFDERFDMDSLSLKEIDKALNNSKIHFEIIAFQNCLMSSYEVAHTIRNFSNYMIASEEICFLWDWEAVCSKLIKNPKMNSLEYSKFIAKSWAKSIADYGNDAYAISVIDLSQIDNLTDKLSSIFSDKVQCSTREDMIYNAFTRTKPEIFGGLYYNMVDLGDFIHFIYPNEEGDLKEFTDALKKAVPYLKCGKLREFSTGLSIFCPYQNKDNLKENVEIYDEFNICEEYEQFCNDFVRELRRDNEPPKVEISYDDTNCSNKILIKPVGENDIEHIDASIGYIENGKFCTIYTDDYGYEYIDEENGYWKYSFDYLYPSLNDNIVQMNRVSSVDGRFEYDVPVLLNGKKVNLKVFAIENGKNLNYKSYYAVDDNSIYKIMTGDKITPLYEVYDYNNDRVYYVEGNPILIDESGLSFTFKHDDTIKPFVLFSVYDYAQNKFMSDYIEVQHTKNVKSTDGICEITLSHFWEEVDNLNPVANIQANTISKDKYLINISESKDTFVNSLTIDNYYEIISNDMANKLISPKLSSPVDITINGKKAKQFEITGEVNGIKIGFIVTIVETYENFHQITGWTLINKFPKYKEEYNQIINTFKEI